MPIDNALEKLEGNKSGDNTKNIIVQDDKEFELFKLAQNELGNYLVSIFQVSGSMKQFLTKLCPTIMSIYPKAFHNNPHNYQEIKFLNLDKDYWIYCLKTISENLLDTDLVDIKGETINVMQEAESYIPGIASFKAVFSRTQQSMHHPYILPLGMRSKTRPLVVSAIANSFDSKSLFYEPDLDIQKRKNYLITSAPSLDEIAKVAQVYNIKNLKPIISDLNSVISSYMEIWP